MASRFSDIVDAVVTRMAAPAIGIGKGRLALKLSADWPRIVFVPVSVDHEFTHDIGGKLIPGTISTPDHRAVAILTRAIEVHAYVWGGPDEQDIEVTEAMVHALIVACREELCGSLQWLGEDWPTQSERADYAVSGELAIVKMRWHVPVVSEDKNLTELTHHYARTQFVSDLTGIPETICEFNAT